MITKILILEAQSQELARAVHERGDLIGSEMFIKTFQEFNPALEFVVNTPYSATFDPHILHDVGGVVLTGSSVPWSVDADEARPLQNACHAAFNSGLPIWGSCNGLQMAALLLGGEIGASPKGFETGLAQELQLTDAGQSHPMMKGRTSPFEVPCVHRDEVQKLPDGAVLLAENSHSPIQAFAYEQSGVRFWGTQYHPEMRAVDVAHALQSGQGIFSDDAGQALDLTRAEEDEEAAKRAGTSMEAMQTHTRALELKNWLSEYF